MENKIPKTLDEAIDMLIAMNLTGIPGGMGMRNSWGLWSGSELAQWFYCHKIYHADDMSGIISDSYKKRLSGEPLELDKQIAFYHNHWRKTYGDNHLEIMRNHVIEYLSKMRDERIDKILSKI